MRAHNGKIMVLIGLLASVAPGLAALPTTINYQGKLTKADGTPMDTGPILLKAIVYDTAVDGTRIWGPQTFTNVPVVAGCFNVIIGPTDDSGASLMNAFSGGRRYLEVSVAGNPPVVPRQQVLSAPFAQYAGNDVPIGGIVAWIPPVPLESLTMEAAKSMLPAGFVVCDGPRLTDDLSTAYDERRIPQLTDGRFLRAGAVTNLATAGGGSPHQHAFFPPSQYGRTGPGDTLTGEAWSTAEARAIGGHTHRYDGSISSSTPVPRHCNVLFIIRVN
jgi:hypothetical protein